VDESSAQAVKIYESPEYVIWYDPDQSEVPAVLADLDFQNLNRFFTAQGLTSPLSGGTFMVLYKPWSQYIYVTIIPFMKDENDTAMVFYARWSKPPITDRWAVRVTGTGNQAVLTVYLAKDGQVFQSEPMGPASSDSPEGTSSITEPPQSVVSKFGKCWKECMSKEFQSLLTLLMKALKSVFDCAKQTKDPRAFLACLFKENVLPIIGKALECVVAATRCFST